MNMEETMYTLSVAQGPAAASATATAWSQYLRRVTAHACMSFGLLSAQLVTNDAACKIPEDEWLRMYHYITRRFEMAKSGSYLTAASMMVMLGRNDTEVANASKVGSVKKAIRNQLACEIADDPCMRKNADFLSAKFRTGTTVLITDLMIRVGTAQLVNDIGGWPCRHGLGSCEEP